jgi:hypothetical protein
MEKRFVFLGSLLNLATLTLGIALGFILGTAYSGHVHAQATQPEVEQIQPMITAGSAAFGTLLAGRFAGDEIDSHGVNLLKFDQNLLTLLGSKPLWFSHDELQNVINESVAPKILQVKPPPSVPNKPTEKKPQEK